MSTIHFSCRYDQIISNEISSLYMKLDKGNITPSEITQLAEKLVIYRWFHEKINDFLPRRTSDFYSTCRQIFHKLEALGDIYVQAWKKGAESVEEITYDEKALRVPGCRFLSDLTTTHAEICKRRRRRIGQ